jgi:hypothetical protein
VVAFVEEGVDDALELAVVAAVVVTVLVCVLTAVVVADDVSVDDCVVTSQPTKMPELWSSNALFSTATLSLHSASVGIER